MKISALLLCSSLFALQPILAAPTMAQDADPDVAESEAPEDEIIAPQPDVEPVVPIEQVAQGTLPDDSGDADEEKDWDITAPPGATIRQVPIRTDEGTWMDVDVSPDGRMVAFSLLGDIYTMPITGGTPTRIAEGSGVGGAAAFLSRRAPHRLHLRPGWGGQYLGHGCERRQHGAGHG